MPKMRGFKTEIWTDEKFVELTPLARLLFMGMWNYACDNGHVENKPRQFKLRLLPADDCSIKDLLAELLEQGMVVDVDTHLVIPALPEHQRIDKRYFTPCEHCTPDEIPAEMYAHRAHRSQGARRADPGQSEGAHSVPALKGSEGKGKEGEGEGEREGATPSPAAKGEKKRAHQMPEDFRPNEAHITLAAEVGVDLRAEWPQFVDHHRSRGSTMKDWDAALRTWIRNAVKFGRGGPAAKVRVLPQAQDLELPPDGLSPEEYAAWDRDQRARRRA